MAAQFIGVTVSVTLKSPANIQLDGLVADVAGQQLILHDVYVRQTGHQLPEYRVDGLQIADLEVLPERHVSPLPLDVPNIAPPHAKASQFQQIYPQPAKVGALAPEPRKSLSSAHFPDPAILSYGRKPSAPQPEAPLRTVTNQSRSSEPQELQSRNVSVSVPITSSETASQPQATEHVRTEFTVPAIPLRHEPDPTSATLNAPFNDLSLNGHGEGFGTDPAVNDKDLTPHAPVYIDAFEAPPKNDEYTGKRSRRGGRGKGHKDAANEVRPAELDAPEGVTSPEVSLKQARAIRTKEARQASRVETANGKNERIPGLITGAAGRQAIKSSKRKNRSQRAMLGDDNDGWATEEATDIQGLGEFDFQGNLSKFDKHAVFDQIRTEDTTADEERLVSFNRLPRARPGTAGGKNLHPTENVLDMPDGPNEWIASTEEDEEYKENENDGRVRSRGGSIRGISRASAVSARRPSSRKESAVIASAGQTLLTPSAHTLNSLNANNRSQYSSSHASTKLRKVSSSTTSQFLDPSSSTSAKPSLRLVPGNRLCPTLSPVQMLELEHLAEYEFGLTEDMMIENAARGIAELALSALNPGGKRLSHAPATPNTSRNNNPAPLVVLLTGNHKYGARAVAAARHLRSHGVRVLITILGLERGDSELCEPVRRQLSLFRKMTGGGGNGKVEPWETALTSLNSKDDSMTPPELIVDALLGWHVPYEELRVDDQEAVCEMARWANRAKAGVLAVDCPSGVDGSSGLAPSPSSHTPMINPTLIACLGAPKTGILAAMSNSGPSSSISSSSAPMAKSISSSSSHHLHHAAAAAAEPTHWRLYVLDIGLGPGAWRKYGSRRRQGVEFGGRWVVELRWQGGVE
ncbi:MAG: hypothetical protein M1819_000372 [Sarea resinae]|nr:MAG: hypothetical protein M1819_000372 [Sarea resinae]